MTPKNKVRPEGKDKETDWRQARTAPKASKEDIAHKWSEEEDDCPSGDRFGEALTSARRHALETHDSDDSHQKAKQVAGTKHQAAEVSPEDQRRPKTMKHQDVTTADFSNDANNVPPNVQTKKSKGWQGASLTAPSPFGAGYIANLNPLVSQEQDPREFAIDPGDFYMPRRIRPKRTNAVSDLLEGRNPIDETRVRKYHVQLKSQATAQKQPVTRAQDSRIKSPSQVYIEDTGNSRDDKDEASTDLEDETPSTGPLMGTKDDHYPNWQELINFMDLSKSRLLEDESALNFLRSLEPRIVDGCQEYFKPHTLFLSLARKANIAKRRERFEEYLVEAPREWYCFTTVCNYGYEDENALASEENCGSCGCPQKQKTCLQVRIRRGKLGAFDVRFR